MPLRDVSSLLVFRLRRQSYRLDNQLVHFHQLLYRRVPRYEFLRQYVSSVFSSRDTSNTPQFTLAVAHPQGVDVDLQSALHRAAILSDKIEQLATVDESLESSLQSNQHLQRLADDVHTIECNYQCMKYKNPRRSWNPVAAMWTMTNDVCASLLACYEAHKPEPSFKFGGICEWYIGQRHNLDRPKINLDEVESNISVSFKGIIKVLRVLKCALAIWALPGPINWTDAQTSGL